MRRRRATWPSLDIAVEHQAGGRGDDVEPGVARQQLAVLRFGDADAGPRGVARGGQPIDVGLADEAAVDQLQRAVEIGLGEVRVGPRDFDLRRRALRLLGLHRAVDHRQHLARADPVAGLDRDRDHAAAFADHADRHLAPRGERAGGADRACDGGAAGRDHRDRRDLLALLRRERPAPRRR